MTDADFQAVLLQLDLLEHKGVSPEAKVMIDTLKQAVPTIMTNTNLSLPMRQTRLEAMQRSLPYLEANDLELAEIHVNCLRDLLY